MNSALAMSTLTTHSAANAINEPTTPTPIDVLCGTGIERVNQPGNELFTVCVLKYVEQYTHAQTKKHKMSISKAALDELTELGVRFLKKHPSHQCWYVADQKVGRDRIGHFLRQHVDKNERKGLQPSPSMHPMVPLSSVLRARQARAVSGSSSSPRSDVLASSSGNSVGTNEKRKDGHRDATTCRSTYDVNVGSPSAAERLQSRIITSPSSPRFLLGPTSFDHQELKSSCQVKKANTFGVNQTSSVRSLNGVNTKKEKSASAFVKEAGSCYVQPFEMYNECSTIDDSKSEGTTCVSPQTCVFPERKPIMIGHVYSNSPAKIAGDITFSDLTYMECYKRDCVDTNSCKIVDFCDDVDLFDEADLAECLDWQAINYI